MQAFSVALPFVTHTNFHSLELNFLSLEEAESLKCGAKVVAELSTSKKMCEKGYICYFY